MRLDPALASVLVALIGAVAAVVGHRANLASKRSERELAARTAAAALVEEERERRDADWRYLEASRDAAIADAARERAGRLAAEAQLGTAVATLDAARLPIPDRPHNPHTPLE